MNAAIQPRQSRLIRCGGKAGEAAGVHAFVNMGIVVKGVAVPEYLFQYPGGSGGLGGMARGIFRERRGDQQRLPVLVNQFPDLADGAQQVILVL